LVFLKRLEDEKPRRNPTAYPFSGPCGDRFRSQRRADNPSRITFSHYFSKKTGKVINQPKDLR